MDCLLILEHCLPSSSPHHNGMANPDGVLLNNSLKHGCGSFALVHWACGICRPRTLQIALTEVNLVSSCAVSSTSIYMKNMNNIPQEINSTRDFTCRPPCIHFKASADCFLEHTDNMTKIKGNSNCLTAG
jgi:hypothetical protein